MRLAERLDALTTILSQQWPRLLADFHEGASVDDLAAWVEFIPDVSLPPELRTLWTWRNGQEGRRCLHPDLAFWLLNVRRSARLWRFFTDPDTELDVPWPASWIPLFENAVGDALAFSTEDGKIRVYWHDAPHREVVFRSLIALVDEAAKLRANSMEPVLRPIDAVPVAHLTVAIFVEAPVKDMALVKRTRELTGGALAEIARSYRDPSHPVWSLNLAHARGCTDRASQLTAAHRLGTAIVAAGGTPIVKCWKNEDPERSDLQVKHEDLLELGRRATSL